MKNSKFIFEFSFNSYESCHSFNLDNISVYDDLLKFTFNFNVNGETLHCSKIYKTNAVNLLTSK